MITGGAGNDTLDGGAGADTPIGGAGDDIYIVDSVADIVTESTDAGNRYGEGCIVGLYACRQYREP